jgi:hypothetical protein
MGRRITHDDAISLAENLYKWSGENELIGTLSGEEFIWYDYFKKFIFMNKGTDKHTIKKYRDLMRYYGLLEFDVFDHVFFKFRTNKDYKINKKTGLGGWLDD